MAIHNTVNDMDSLTGTWGTWKVGTPISEEEYREAWDKALNHPGLVIK